MIPDIQSGVSVVLATKKRTFPQSVNRISSMDDPCLRRLYYRRAAWDKAAPTPDSLQGVFETGNVLEPVIERIVSEIGHASTPPWRIVGAQTPTNDAFLKKYNISGSIDGFLQMQLVSFHQEPGKAPWTEWVWVTQSVVDIKTMSPNVYPQINSYEDLAKYPWTRGYRGQVMLYAFAHNLENCCLLLVNKSNLFDMKLIHFQIDMAYLEGLLQRAEAINLAIECEEPPAGINDPDQCPKCQWFSYCCPDVTTGGNLEIVDNTELEAVLTRMDELLPASKEYSDLEKARDLMLTKGRDVVCGPFMVTWKESSNHVWRKRIVRMK
jgi:hypothetical protein